MSFPGIHAQKRDDTSFRLRKDHGHHRESSPLENLPIDMIKDFPIADSLHLLDIGIMKRFLEGWIHGKFNYNTKWSGKQIREISEFLTEPIEIHRKVRTLDTLKLWKATEFRTFFLYLGIVILRDYLQNDIYQHFLLLFCSITIYTTKYYSKFFCVAEKMIIDYIELYCNLYGRDTVTSNIHNLSHIIEDVSNFEDLQNISSYPFENHLRMIKNLVRTGNRPLAQVAKRLLESSKTVKDQDQNGTFPQLLHQFGESHNENNCVGMYTTVLINKEFCLKNDEKNQWFLTTDNKIVAMINATYRNKEIMIYGCNKFHGTNFFNYPIASSTLHIYSASILNNMEKKLYSLQDIKCKLFKIHYRNEIIFLPLLHTLQ
uniref:Transposase domain-containing protein n=1 Tax=Phlebotomus papatasi TaxID=29031 RepID=A0A1B0D314_PHLPP